MAALGLATTSVAQLEWEYSGISEYSYSRAWYCYELEPGVYGASIEEYRPNARSKGHFVLFENGSPTIVDYPGQPGWWISSVAPFHDVTLDQWHILSAVRDSLTGATIGLYYVILNNEYAIVSDTLLEEWQGHTFFSGDATSLSSGGVLFVQSTSTETQPLNADLLTFIRLRSDGSPPDMRTYEVSFGVGDVDEEPYGYRVTGSGSGLGPPGYGKLIDFDHDFNYLGAIVMPNANGFPYQPGQDTAFATYESERLPSGDLLASCERIIALTPFAPFQQRAFLAKVSPTGQLVDGFDTPAPPPGIRSRVIRYSLRPTTDGHYLWGYEENEEVLDYSRVHLYKFTADLEVVGHILLDGNELDTHFEPRALVPTSDGGVLVCGAQDGLEDGIWAPHTYVAKFSGFTSLEEQAAAPVEVVAYPNPGRIMRLAVNGPILPQAIVQLFDASGRQVAQAPLQFNQAYLDTEPLASGLYTYRLVSPQRGVVATGRWVRE